jgi:hypothetical protein
LQVAIAISLRLPRGGDGFLIGRWLRKPQRRGSGQLLPKDIKGGGGTDLGYPGGLRDVVSR